MSDELSGEIRSEMLFDISFGVLSFISREFVSSCFVEFCWMKLMEICFTVGECAGFCREKTCRTLTAEPLFFASTSFR